MKHGFIAIVLLAFIAIGVRSITQSNNRIQLKDIQLKDTSAELKSLQLKYETLNVDLETELHQKNINKEKAEQLEKERNQLKKKLNQTEIELQAKLEAKRIAAERTQSAAKKLLGTQTAYAASSTGNGSGGCGDNEYARYIYMKESGCRTDALNSIGCRGIGQACPGHKLPCGADYACQNAWFTNYAQTRYNGWKGAYDFWIINHWW